MINVIPAQEESNETLLLTCGKNSNGPEFAPVAVKLNAGMIYEVADGFDIHAWREHVVSGKAQKFNVNMLRKVEFNGQLPLKRLTKLICKETGCGRSRAYELVHEGLKAKIFRYDELLQTYARI
jgi:hypothetical protein